MFDFVNDHVPWLLPLLAMTFIIAMFNPDGLFGRIWFYERRNRDKGRDKS